MPLFEGEVKPRKESPALLDVVQHVSKNHGTRLIQHIVDNVADEDRNFSGRVINVAIAEAALRMRGGLVERLKLALTQRAIWGTLHPYVVADMRYFVERLAAAAASEPKSVISYQKAARASSQRLYEDLIQGTSDLRLNAPITLLATQSHGFSLRDRASADKIVAAARAILAEIEPLVAAAPPKPEATPAWSVGTYQAGGLAATYSAPAPQTDQYQSLLMDRAIAGARHRALVFASTTPV